MTTRLTVAALLLSISVYGQISLDSLFTVPDGYERITYPELSFANYVQSATKVTPGLRRWLTTSEPLKTQQNHAAIIDMKSYTDTFNAFDCADFVVTYLVKHHSELEEFLRPSNYAYHYEHKTGFTNDLRYYDSLTCPLYPYYLLQSMDTFDIGFTCSNGQFEYQMDWHCNQSGVRSNHDYLRYIYTQTNTTTLVHDLETVWLSQLQPGDVFIVPKSAAVTGHVAMVMDVAVNRVTGDKVFLLGQGMPSQTPHILANPNGTISLVWYSLSEIKTALITPSFIYPHAQLACKRFKAVLPFVNGF